MPNKVGLTRLLGWTALAMSSFALGVAVDHYRIFPYHEIRYVYGFIKHRVVQHGSSTDSAVASQSVSVNNLLTISTTKEAYDRQASLIRFFWKDGALPALRASAESNVTPKSVIPRSKSVRELVVRMPHGFDIRASFYEAENSNGVLVIYVTGHGGTSERDRSNVATLLDSGFDVILSDLVMIGNNSRPTIAVPGVGQVRFTTHDQLKYLESPSFNPLVLFVEPVAQFVNYAHAARHYSKTVLIGVSGGSTVATLYAALDTRVSRTYAVAGAAPAFLRFAYPETLWGDYEQTHPALTSVLSDLDLYVLASLGNQRRYIQIFNQFDPCCYSLNVYRVYQTAIQDRLLSLGSGTFDIWRDSSHFEHQLSKVFIGRIIADIW